jgi:3',5'-cyclic AMP phosphodiesterase CpdA
MTLLLQVSDPHFGTERAPVVAALEALVREQRPDVLLLSGDITQRATRAQFAAARAFVDRLQLPAVVAVPGNHDIPLFNLAARLLWPYARYARAFGSELEPQFERDDVLVQALNTTRRWRHVNGELSAEQIERVARRCEQAPAEQWRIVVVHQPVAVTRPQDAHNLLRGHEAAVRRWSAAGVDVVLGGHIHLPFVLPLQERWPGLARPIWAVQAGTAVSHRVRAEAGNSVNLLRITADTAKPASAGNTRSHALQVERWDHAAAAQRFECVAVHRLPVRHER